ncbi:hypothetical protein DF186_14400, partial [Enterococcus hirae]
DLFYHRRQPGHPRTEANGGQDVAAFGHVRSPAEVQHALHRFAPLRFHRDRHPVSSHPGADHPHHRVVPGPDARAVDGDDPVPFLEPGRGGLLAVHGPQVMAGYWQDPDGTAA